MKMNFENPVEFSASEIDDIRKCIDKLISNYVIQSSWFDIINNQLRKNYPDVLKSKIGNKYATTLDEILRKHYDSTINYGEIAEQFKKLILEKAWKRRDYVKQIYYNDERCKYIGWQIAFCNKYGNPMELNQLINTPFEKRFIGIYTNEFKNIKLIGVLRLKGIEKNFSSMKEIAIKQSTKLVDTYIEEINNI